MCTSPCQAARACERTDYVSGCASQLSAAIGASLDCLVFVEALTVCQASQQARFSRKVLTHLHIATSHMHLSKSGLGWQLSAGQTAVSIVLGPPA